MDRQKGMHRGVLCPLGLDVVAVELDQKGKLSRIELIENAIGEG